MKISFIVALLLVVTANAQTPRRPGHEGGNGGEYCAQSIKSIVPKLKASVAKQSAVFKEAFETDVFNWFADKSTYEVVDQLSTGCKRPDACNFPSKRLIELARSKFCGLGEVEKAKILFHEILGVMDVEGDNDYTVSSKLVYIDVANRWACHVTSYCPILFAKSFHPGETPVPFVSLTTGASLEEALTGLENIKLTCYNSKPIHCYRLGSNVATNGYVHFFCSEFTNAVNSCVERSR